VAKLDRQCGFKILLDTSWVILEMILPANHLTRSSKTNQITSQKTQATVTKRPTYPGKAKHNNKAKCCFRRKQIRPIVQLQKSACDKNGRTNAMIV